jgi:hypothetical protein
MCELAAVDDFANRPVSFFYPLVYVLPPLSVVPSLAPTMLTSSSIPTPIRIEVLNVDTTDSGNGGGVLQRDDVDDGDAVPPSVAPSLAPSMLTSSSIPSPDSGNDNGVVQRDDIDDGGDDGDDDTDTSSSSLLLTLCSCLL